MSSIVPFSDQQSSKIAEVCSFKPQPPARLEGIQFLRFIAAALVIWAHWKAAYAESGIWLVDTSAGAVGVDIFFVISGFVISMSAARAGGGWRMFMANRIARVAPLYYLYSLPYFAKDVWQSGSGLEFDRWWNSFLFIPLFDLGAFTNPYHGYGWTLSFEMWFYVCFAVVLCTGAKCPGKILAGIFIVGALAVFPFYDGKWFFLKFAFNPMVVEFALGCILYYLAGRGTKAFVVSIAALLPVLFVFVFKTQSLGWHPDILAEPTLAYCRMFLWGGLAVGIVYVVVWLDMNCRLRLPRVAVLLGEASYSIYLVQLLALKITQAIFPSGMASLVFFTCASVLGGLASYFLLERPITHVAKKLMTSLAVRH